MAASTPDNLYPIFDRVLGRADKEAKLKQRGRVIWLYGLSGSGKSTLAIALERRLHAEGFTTHLLDGDNVRSGLNRDLGFTDADRSENIRRIAEVAKLFVQAGVVVIAAFITPQRAHRQLARTIIGADDFSEVYVAASFDTCAARDPKGLYAKAKAGNVQQFTGRDSSFEPPLAEDTDAQTIDTEAGTAADSLNQLHTAILPRITFQ
jgi:adenylylsulfate kinase